MKKIMVIIDGGIMGIAEDKVDFIGLEIAHFHNGFLDNIPANHDLHITMEIKPNRFASQV